MTTPLTVEQLVQTAIEDGFDAYVGDKNVESEARGTIGTITFDHDGVPAPVFEEAVSQLVAWAEQKQRERERDEALALQDAREAGLVNSRDEEFFLSEYYS